MVSELDLTCLPRSSFLKNTLPIRLCLEGLQLGSLKVWLKCQYFLLRPSQSQKHSLPATLKAFVAFLVTEPVVLFTVVICKLGFPIHSYIITSFIVRHGEGQHEGERHGDDSQRD